MRGREGGLSFQNLWEPGRLGLRLKLGGAKPINLSLKIASLTVFHEVLELEKRRRQAQHGDLVDGRRFAIAGHQTR